MMPYTISGVHYVLQVPPITEYWRYYIMFVIVILFLLVVAIDARAYLRFRAQLDRMQSELDTLKDIMYANSVYIDETGDLVEGET